MTEASYKKHLAIICISIKYVFFSIPVYKYKVCVKFVFVLFYFVFVCERTIYDESNRWMEGSIWDDGRKTNIYLKIQTDNIYMIFFFI